MFGLIFHTFYLQAMDIEEILQRAETQENVDDSSVNEDLLSQFKVCDIYLLYLLFLVQF